MSELSNVNLIKSTKAATDKWTVLETGLYKMLRDNFSNYKDFYVISNLKKFNPANDPFIFGQKTDRIPEICEVYCKGEYACEVTIFDTPAQALVKIQDGLIEIMTTKKFNSKRKEGG